MKLEFEKIYPTPEGEPETARVRAIQITKQEAWAVGMSIRATVGKVMKREDPRDGTWVSSPLAWLMFMSNEGWQTIAREAMKSVFPMLIVEEIEIDVVRAADDAGRDAIRAAMEGLGIRLWLLPDAKINPDYAERKVMEWKGTSILVERDGYGALRMVSIAPELEIEEAVSDDGAGDVPNGAGD